MEYTVYEKYIDIYMIHYWYCQPITCHSPCKLLHHNDKNYSFISTWLYTMRLYASTNMWLEYIAVLVVNYGISNTIVLEIP